MNWLGIAVLIILLIGLIVGIVKGAIKIAVSLLVTVVTIVMVFFATPYVSKAVTDFTPVQEVVETKIGRMITEIETAAMGDQIAGGSGDIEVIRRALNAAGVTEADLAAHGVTLQDFANGNVSGEELAQFGISRSVLDGLKNVDASQEEEETVREDLTRDQQIAFVEGSGLPKIFQTLLLTNNNNDTYQGLGVTYFNEYVARYLAKVVVNIIAFLLTFLVITIIIRAIVFALNVIADLPGLGIVNHMAGGVVGIGGALVLIWILFVVITLLYTTQIGQEMFMMIRGNELLQTLYDVNPIMKIATILRG